MNSISRRNVLTAATAGGFKPVRAKRVYLSDEGDLIIEIADAQPV